MSLTLCVRNGAKSSRWSPVLTRSIPVFSLVGTTLPTAFLCSVWWYHFTRCIPVFGLVAPLKQLSTLVAVRKPHTCSTSPKAKTGRIRGFQLLIMFPSSIQSRLPGPGTAFNYCFNHHLNISTSSSIKIKQLNFGTSDGIINDASRDILFEG